MWLLLLAALGSQLEHRTPSTSNKRTAVLPFRAFNRLMWIHLDGQLFTIHSDTRRVGASPISSAIHVQFLESFPAPSWGSEILEGVRLSELNQTEKTNTE